MTPPVKRRSAYCLQFKGCDALKREINPTRVPVEQKESFRWLENLRQASRLLGEPGRLVHVGDREADIFELLAAAAEEGTRFLVRTCVDRLWLTIVVAWRVFWLSMARRAEPESSPTLALTAEECRVLDRLTPAKPLVGTEARTPSAYLTKVARLGGYLARAKDPPPGFIVLWRRFCRLLDIQTGV